MTDMYTAILLGVAVGDALGVPVEFMRRESLTQAPVTGMRAFGTHQQPAGTFSDDSSLTFCLAESLTQAFSLESLAENCIKWYREAWWTAHGKVFDIGIATREALHRLEQGVKPERAGGIDEYSNGNGSLMRILFLLSLTRHLPPEARFQLVRQVSSLTHGHVRSVIACYYYLEFARLLCTERDPHQVYAQVQAGVKECLRREQISAAETAHFSRLLEGNLAALPATAIGSSGYVVHTLEASIWCLLNTESWSRAVLLAVNLGEDTDTTAAVTGGLAALCYGADAIPAEWLAQLARKDDILDLARRWAASSGE